MLTKNACLLNRIFSHSVDAFYSSEKKTLRQYRMVKSVVCLYVMCLLVCADTLLVKYPREPQKRNGKCGISSFSTTQLYLSTNPSSYKIHTLFSLHFSQVALLFQDQTNIAHNHRQSVEIKVNKVRCFKTPTLSSC